MTVGRFPPCGTDWRQSAHRARTTLTSNTRHSPDAVLMLGQRRRQWTNIGTALGECLVFAGYVYWHVFFINKNHHTAVHMIATRGGIGVGLWCCLVVCVSEPT